MKREHINKSVIKLFTSPIPEEAPVMITTLSSISSPKKELYIHSQVLMKYKAGHEKASITKLAGGTTKFSTEFTKSIISFDHFNKKERKTEGGYNLFFAFGDMCRCREDKQEYAWSWTRALRIWWRMFLELNAWDHTSHYLFWVISSHFKLIAGEALFSNKIIFVLINLFNMCIFQSIINKNKLLSKIKRIAENAQA